MAYLPEMQERMRREVVLGLDRPVHDLLPPLIGGPPFPVRGRRVARGVAVDRLRPRSFRRRLGVLGRNGPVNGHQDRECARVHKPPLTLKNRDYPN
jgi:hypothetical protein